MIDPRALLTHRQPPIVLSPGLHRHTGLYAQAEGLVRPFIRTDRLAEGRPGFEALMYHEALHVHERHALAGLVLLFLPVVGVFLWILWRREQEIRADAFALLAASTFAKSREAEKEEPDPAVVAAERAAAGLREFSAFVLLHEHPKSRFWKWCYGRTPAHRVERAVARSRRIRWAAD